MVLEIRFILTFSNLTHAFIIFACFISFFFFANAVSTGACVRAVPWLRRLVAGLSPRIPVFAPGSVNVGFVVVNVALGQVFLRVRSLSPVSIFPPWLSILIYHLGDEHGRSSENSSQTVA
jgi:hypothetical protein